jgi:superfamily II DNA or RNA helicase
MVMSDAASGPRILNETPYQHAYDRCVVRNDHLNMAVIRATEWIVEHGRQVLVLCRRKEQWRTIKAGLEASGIPYEAVWGATHTSVRDMAKRSFGEGNVKVLLGSEVLGEGEDIPNVEALVLAEGVKASTNVIQRIGRGMRLKPHCGDLVWVVDFALTCHRRLFEHAEQRVGFYEAEGHEVRLVENWPELHDKDYAWPDLLPFVEWQASA